MKTNQELRVGIVNSGGGVGDHVQFCGMPENYYLNTGKKLIDLNNSWYFDHNPYVERGVKCDLIIDLYGCLRYSAEGSGNFKKEKINFKDENFYVSQAERFKQILNIEKTYLRHPRLYKYENLQTLKPGIITVHTTGRSEGGTMPDAVIEKIQENYKTYTIYQIGGKEDKKAPFIDKRGLGLWQTSELIASSQIFIGVNSGMMNIAQCYPRVNRKLVLIENHHIETKDFDYYRPLCYYKEGANSPWVDYNWQYYNVYEHDLGITYSYNKI